MYVSVYGHNMKGYLGTLYMSGILINIQCYVSSILLITHSYE